MLSNTEIIVLIIESFKNVDIGVNKFFFINTDFPFNPYNKVVDVSE